MSKAPEMNSIGNPFANSDGIGAVDTESRVGMVKSFNLDQCRAALEVQGLQKTVKNKILSRIRKLEKECEPCLKI